MTALLKQHYHFKIGAGTMNNEEDEPFDAVKSFEESLQQVELHREGKIKLETLAEFRTRTKRDILWEKARENTKRNELGQTTISRDDVWDMIFNPSKRAEMYKALDKNYVSTKEEDDIFNETCQRRKRD